MRGMPRPNILLLVVDTLRADAVFGASRHTVTPTFDRLAREACCFSHVISVNSYTVPCVASLFTGLYPFAHGLRTQRSGKLPTDVIPIASVLSQSGYHTYAESSGPVAEEVGLAAGFQEFNWREGATENLAGAWGEKFRRRLCPGGLRPPWFMYCHIWEVHTPRYIAPQHRSDRFGRDAYQRAVSSFDPLLNDILASAGDDTIVFVTSDHGEIGESEAPELAGARTHQLRRLLHRLLPHRLASALDQAARQAKRRWTTGQTGSSHQVEGSVKRVLTAGHGAHVVEPLIRIPLYLVGPTGLPCGKIVDRVVSQVDIAPTLLEAAGVPDALWQCHGTSLLPLARGEAVSQRDAYFENEGTNAGLSGEEVMTSPWMVGLRTDRYKFWYRRFNNAKYPELYDIVADPGEFHNLAAENPSLVSEMQRKIENLSPQDFDGPSSTALSLSAQELRSVEDRLRGLGYID
jgi:arylsulfatase A-like enzyme